jgi:hypothetical protein
MRKEPLLFNLEIPQIPTFIKTENYKQSESIVYIGPVKRKNANFESLTKDETEKS